MGYIEDRRYSVKLTEGQGILLVYCDTQADVLDIGRRNIGCDWIELIVPEQLQKDGYVIMIDEEAKIKGNNNINCIASYLYESHHHGDPVVGNAMIVKVDGESLVLLTQEQATTLTFSMMQLREQAINTIVEAFQLKGV